MSDLLPIPSPFENGCREFLTAREIVDVVKKRGISNFPGSIQGVIDYANRHGWAGHGAHLCRKRAGRGGGQEYHITLLPQIFRDALAAWGMQAELVRQHQLEQAADEKKIAALRMASLPFHPRKVMVARAEVLRSIEGHAIAHQQTRAWAIARFMSAQDQFDQRLATEQRRDSGHRLTDREVAGLGVPLLLSAHEGFQLTIDLLQVANDRSGRDRNISERTIYRWFKARDEKGVIALAPQPTKQVEPIPDGFHDFMRFYARPSKPSIPKAHKAYMDDVALREGAQPMPVTLAQVKRILNERLNNIEKHVGREGILTLRSRMSYITRTTEDMLPTTVYTADGKTFDAEVADPVSRRPMRPEITSILDVVTHKCVGYAVSRKENVIAVTEALRRACSVHGVCAIFYTDRGAGYKNKTFDADVGGLMARLGITKMHALPYNSQAKGIIERFNHVWNDLAKSMISYIGRDMDKEAKKAVHVETRREIAQFGQARRLPSWEDFIQAVEATIAEYNDRPHRGLPRFEDPVTGSLRHMTPNEAWDMHVATGFEAVMIDPEDMDDLFRPYEIRTAQRGLVEWNTNQYFHPSLERYHKEKVVVGYDLHQADKVWVREFDVSSGQPGKLICVAVFGGNSQRYIPLTAERKAVEDRNKAALKRLDRRRNDKIAEMDEPMFIDHHEAVPVPDFVAMPLRVVTDAPDPAPIEIHDPAPVKRKRFANDVEFAAWALEHPNDLNPNQIIALQRCVKGPATRRYLEMSGIDTEALRTLLRAVA